MATPLRLRLYVAGDAPHSTSALTNLRATLRAHAHVRHDLEVVDVMQHPERALADRVLLTPTLLRLTSGAAARIVGDLHDTPVLLRALGLEAR